MTNKLSDLIARIESGDARARAAALDEIILRSDEAAAAVPAITKLLLDDCKELQKKAIVTLGALGNVAATAVDSLSTFVDSTDVDLRELAKLSIRRITQVDLGQRMRAYLAPRGGGEDTVRGQSRTVILSPELTAEIKKRFKKKIKDD